MGLARRLDPIDELRIGQGDADKAGGHQEENPKGYPVGRFRFHESDEGDQRHDETAEHQHVYDRPKQVEDGIGEAPGGKEYATRDCERQGYERPGDISRQTKKRIPLFGPCVHIDDGWFLDHGDNTFVLEGHAIIDRRRILSDFSESSLGR